MKMYVSEYAELGLRSITIEHKGEKITWDATNYHRSSRVPPGRQTNPDDDQCFREINRFFATLSDESQEEIWKCYVEINELFEFGYDPQVQELKWQNIIGRIYQQIPYDALYEWV